jgi:hypothetical protein
VSKQIIRRLEQAWISYFAAFKAWKKHPEKFLGKPKIIRYKDKTKGRNLLIYWLSSTLCDNFCLWNPEMLIGQDF